METASTPLPVTGGTPQVTGGSLKSGEKEPINAGGSKGLRLDSTYSSKRFTTVHRSILHCRKTRHNRLYKEQVAQPYQNPTEPFPDEDM